MHLNAPTITDADRARFAAKARRDPDSDCTLWTGARDKGGYGRFRVQKKVWQAHRFAYVAARGPIPKGLVVRHRCNTPGCVAVDHLQIGTQAENILDMVEQQRNHCKLSDEDVACCFGLSMLGYKQTDIASMSGVSQQAIRRVLIGKTRRGAVTRELDRVLVKVGSDEAA